MKRRKTSKVSAASRSPKLSRSAGRPSLQEKLEARDEESIKLALHLDDSDEDEISFDAIEPFSPIPTSCDEECLDSDSNPNDKNHQTKEEDPLKISTKKRKPVKKQSKKGKGNTNTEGELKLESVIDHEKVGAVRVVLDKLPEAFVQEYVKYLRTTINEDGDEPYTRERAPLMANALREMSTSQECVICKKEFKNGRKLGLHLREHGGPEGFTCMCKQIFKTYKNFYQHIAKKHKHPFKCPYCDLKFPGAEFWLKHTQESHSKSYPYLCTLCGKGFVKTFMLLEHFNQHTGLKPHKCPQCQRAYRTADALREHKLQHIMQFKCKICSKVYSSARMLRTHVLIHEPGRKFECDICGKSFKYQSNLGNHRQVHGEKKFSCNTCGLKFGRRQEYARHCRLKNHPLLAVVSEEGIKPSPKNIAPKTVRSIKKGRASKAEPQDSPKSSQPESISLPLSENSTRASGGHGIRNQANGLLSIDEYSSEIEMNKEPLFLGTRIYAIMDVEQDSDDESDGSKDILSL